MKRSSLKWMLFGFLALCVVCLAAVLSLYFIQRNRLLNARPLVLISSPLNHAQVRPGEGLPVHATARAEMGIARMELWVDGVLAASQEQPQEGPLSPMALSSVWEETAQGDHVLLVRAISADGVEGQAAVAVQVAGEERPALGAHVIETGETAESIAEEYGISPDDLADLNPGIDLGNLLPGDELVVPGGAGAPSDDEPSAGGDAPLSGGSPPGSQDSAPGSSEEIIEMFDFIPMAFSTEPTGLRIEALGLTTGIAYESLHCYIGMGTMPPRWVPDADFDQTTDESFALTGGASWDVAAHLSGDRAPVFVWPGNVSIPFSLACVGVAGGGTDAIEVGRLDLSIPPLEWDGVTRQAVSSGGEGSFTLDYRVTHTAIPEHHFAILDPNMTPPTNLQISSGRGLYGIGWEYHPRQDEEPIEGFRIYLNGTLQWVESLQARMSRLPPEWYTPPCGEAYNFTVTAFRGTYPDGPESAHSNTFVIAQEPEDCNRILNFTFTRLETYDLGGDGDYENRSGDVGPVYGYFYAGDSLVFFDGRSEQWGGLGLSHNSSYAITGENGLTTSPNWNSSGPAQFELEIPEGEALVLGFDIWDDDTGYGNVDDPVCRGGTWFIESSGLLDTGYEGSILSEDGRCRVYYNFGPAAGSPVGAPSGVLPMPFLNLESLTVDEATNQLQVHVHNTGYASWPRRDLNVAVSAPAGGSLGLYTWPQFELAPGESTILQQSSMTVDPSQIVCVTLDPGNDVMELGEDTGAWSREPVCMTPSDLVITNVEYDAAGQRLLVTIQNQGEGALENRTVKLSVVAYSAMPAPPIEHPGVTLQRWESTVLTLGVPSSIHAGWTSGYTVTVDPDNTIAESDDDNNSFQVPISKRLILWIRNVSVPPGGAANILHARYDGTEFTVTAYAVSASSRRQVGSFTAPPGGEWLSVGQDGCSWRNYDGNALESTFDINGDERLEITITVNPNRDFDPQTGTIVLTADENWGAGPMGPDNTCLYFTGGPGFHNALFYFRPGIWMLQFNVCQVGLR